MGWRTRERRRLETDPVEGWKRRVAPTLGTPRAHAMSIDVEDYFQVEAFFKHVDRDGWEARERRVEANTDQILEMLEEAKATATFFTLGWVAERHPALIQRIVNAGHELASHGLEHRRADSQDREDFVRDITTARKILEDTGGVRVQGYRATSFSISRKNLWAIDALEEAGYTYSSSIFPIRHDLYGIPDAPPVAFHPIVGRAFMEIPPSSVRFLGTNLPCAGGGVFRLLPYWLSKRNLRAASRQKNRPNVFYFHPWEIDPGQPRISGLPFKSRVRHYTNLGRMRAKVEHLLRDFDWRRIDRVYPVSVVPA